MLMRSPSSVAGARATVLIKTENASVTGKKQWVVTEKSQLAAANGVGSSRLHIGRCFEAGGSHRVSREGCMVLRVLV